MTATVDRFLVVFVILVYFDVRLRRVLPGPRRRLSGVQKRELLPLSGDRNMPQSASEIASAA